MLYLTRASIVSLPRFISSFDIINTLEGKYGEIVVVYVTTIRVFILPIRCIGEQYNNFVYITKNGDDSYIELNYTYLNCQVYRLEIDRLNHSQLDIYGDIRPEELKESVVSVGNPEKINFYGNWNKRNCFRI